MFSPSFSYKLIYIFQIDDTDHKGLLKIGDASLCTDKKYTEFAPNCSELNKAAKDRISDYTKTASINYRLMYTEIAVRDINGKTEAFRDYQVRDVLIRSHIKRHTFDYENQGTEWFEVSLNQAISAIKAVKEGRKSLTTGEMEDDYTPISFRREQEAAINKTLDTFKTSDRILWNAKMRFGKTLTALEVAKRMEAKKTIIITHRPVVEDGWFDDFNKIFKNTNYIFGSKNSGEKIEDLENGLQPYVYFASLQDLRGSKLVGGDFDKNEYIFLIDWDLVVIDEAHEGTQTDLGQRVIDTIVNNNVNKKPKVISLSGTPFNLISEYEEGEIYTWDYIMEQQAKALWPVKHFGDSNPYEELPSLDMYTYNLNKSFPGYVDIEDSAFNFREFFKTWTGDPLIDGREKPTSANIGDFVHEDDVNAFLNLITIDDKNSNFPFSNVEFRNYYKHTLWVVPGVKEARALSALLSKHPVFGNEQFFKIANVAGEGDEEVPFNNALELVRSTIGTNPDDHYSITITCSSGRLTTGVTVPEWTAVLMLAGSCKTSPSSYLQTVFRVQNPANINGRIKDRCSVFDFAPDRTLKMVAEAANLSTRAGVVNTDRKNMELFLNYCPVVSLDGSQMITYDVDHLLQQLNRVYADRAVQNGFDDRHIYNDNLLKLDDIDLDEFYKLEAIIGASKQTKKVEDIPINAQGFTDEEYADLLNAEEKKRKRWVLTDKEKELLQQQKERRENARKAISILRGISIRIPLMIYGTDIPFDEEITLDNFTKLIDEASWREFMPDGVDKTMFNKFKKYYETDIFVAAGRKIRQIAKAADEFEPTERVKHIADLFNTFKNPDKETVLTPWRVVNMHMSKCLGGYKFYDDDDQTLLEEPVLVDCGDPTKNVFKNPKTKILEINSKSGLYPLYAAHSVYKFKIVNLKIDQNDLEKLWSIWKETVEENIYAICKTPMAKTITKRTLLGYRDGKVNAHYFEDLGMQMKDKPEQFREKISRGSYWNKEVQKMKFNAVVGNPPYAQIIGNDQNRSLSTQLFPYFIMNSILLKPDYVSLICPSRWFAGEAQDKSFITLRNFLKQGYGNSFRKIYSFDSTYPIFDNVEIKGGVSFFLYDSSYDGDVEFNIISEIGAKQQIRPLFEEDLDIVFADSVQYDIYKKVNSDNFVSLMTMTKGRNAFGIVGKESVVESCTFPNPLSHDSAEVRCKDNEIRYIDQKLITKSRDVFENYKVFISKSAGDPTKDKKVIGVPYIGRPYSACTDSLIPIGCFKTETEAVNLAKYLQTKFLRFMVSILKSSQNVYQNVYKFVPVQNFTNNSDIDWWGSIPDIDAQLYKKYGITSEEQAHIDALIRY